MNRRGQGLCLPMPMLMSELGTTGLGRARLDGARAAASYSKQAMRLRKLSESKPTVNRISLHSCSTLCAVLLLVADAMFLPFRAAAQAPAKPAEFDSLASRAAAARDSDQLDQAVSLYRKALVLRPNWAEGWWSLGTIEYDRNDYATGARDFQKLLPLAPKDGTARVMLGLCEFELGEDAPALRNIRDGLALGVANDEQLQQVALFHEGTLLLREGQFKIAHKVFGSLCKIDGDKGQVMDGMALTVLRILPKDAPASGPGAEVVRRVGYAACLSSMKKFDEADEEYSKLLADDPDFPNLHYAYGLSLVESNAIPKAVEQFKIAIDQNANDVEARLEIAASLYKVDSNAALPYAQEAVALRPQQPFAHYLLGLLLLDTNQNAKAIPELEIAAKAFPKEKKIFFALASAYSRVGKREDAEKARAVFERLDKEVPGESSLSY
jgi:tetratricopeptide (TPR) repeat protein